MAVGSDGWTGGRTDGHGSVSWGLEGQEFNASCLWLAAGGILSWISVDAPPCPETMSGSGGGGGRQHVAARSSCSSCSSSSGRKPQEAVAAGSRPGGD